MKQCLPITILLAILPGVAAADPSFVGLGTLGGESSTVTDLSDDGSRVVGASDNGTFTEAYVWSAGTMTGLGDLGGQNSAATAISDDLATIVGTSLNGARDEAFSWTAASGITGLGHIGDGPSAATGVSADGSVVVGTNGLSIRTALQSDPPTVFPPLLPGDQTAFRWTAATGMESLGVLETPLEENQLGTIFQETIEGFGSIGAGVSADGETIFGSLVTYLSYFQVRFRVLDTIPHAFTWTEASGFQRVIPAGTGSNATAANNDLSELVGDRIYTLDTSNPQNPIYTVGDAPLLAHTDTSEDGSLQVGALASSTSSRVTAAIARGSANVLKPYLYSVNLDPTGWTLTGVQAVSSDGLTLAGQGINPRGFAEGWIVQLDTLPNSTDLDALPDYFFEGLTSAVLPSVRTAVVAQAVTVFASIANASEQLALGCRIALADSLPITLDYHRTNPATNATVGAQNTPVDIPPGATQSFVIGFTPTAAFPATDLRLVYDCENGDPAQFRPTLNSVRLEGTNVAQPDVVALSGTTTNDGLIRLPNRFSSGAFVVAAANVGAAGAITVRPDDGDQELPVDLFICETDPPTGQCKQPPSVEVTITMAEQATATFGIFVNTNLMPVDFLPGVNRVFVRFIDQSGGEIRGATSVALAIDDRRDLPFVAIAAVTAESDGILLLSATGETGAFAVSISNATAPETVIIQATNPRNLPVELSLCETDAAGACLAPPVSSLEYDFLPNAGIAAFASIAVFASATDAIPRDDRNRVFVTVTTPDGAIGERSIQVTTQALP